MRSVPAIALAQLMLSLAVEAATVTGVVQSREGVPIGGAVIEAYAPETPPAWRKRIVSAKPQRVALASAKTRQNGAFVVDAAGRAVLDLAVSAPGYAPALVRVAAGEDAGVIPVAKAPSVRGRVSCGDLPAAAATVVVTGAGEVVTRTDSAGFYDVPAPKEWARRIVISHPDCGLADEELRPNASFDANRRLLRGVPVDGVATDARGTPVPHASVFLDGWPAGETADDGKFRAPHTASAWKRVTVSTNDLEGETARANGGASVKVTLRKMSIVAGALKDAASGTPVEGAEVKLSLPGARGGEDVVLTGRDGGFEVRGLFSGSYVISARHPGFSLVGDTVNVAPGERTTKNLYVRRASTIVGFIRTGSGAAVSAADISVISRRGRADLASSFLLDRICCFSDGTGRFVVATIPAGQAIHIVGAKPRLPSARSGDLSLAPGETKSGIVLTVPAGVPVHGRVTDEQGAPLEAVLVSIREPQGGASSAELPVAEQIASTNRRGELEMTVSPGHYDVVYTKRGFVTAKAAGVMIDAAAKPLDMSLSAGAAVSGRVQRNDQPVADVRVSVMTKVGEIYTTSGPDGSFELQDLPPGRVTVVASRPGELVRGYAIATAPAAGVVLNYPPERHLRGRVIDASTKNPITSFQVGVNTMSSFGDMRIALPAVLQDRFDDDGRFDIAVPDGRVDLVVRAAGYALARVGPIAVEGADAPDSEVPLRRGVSLRGRITDPEGAPLSDVVVHRTARLDPGVMPLPGEMVVRTNPDGEYALEALPEGDAAIGIEAAGYVSQTPAVTLRAPSTQLDVTLQPGMRLFGTVRSAAGTPIEGAVVTVRSPSGRTAAHSGTSDATGEFTVEGLAPVRQIVRVSKENYADAVLNEVDLATTPRIEVVLHGGAVITGTVSGLGSEEPRRVFVHAKTSGGQTATQGIDAGGRFRLEHLEAGNVTVWATAEGTETRSSESKTVLADESRPASVDLELGGGFDVRGWVTKNGLPFVDAYVEFRSQRDAEQFAQTRSAANGEYRLAHLKPGAYTVTVSDFVRGSTFHSSYDVRESATHDLAIEAGSLSGRVVSDGMPVQDVTVVLQDSDGTVARRTTTDPNGRFAVPDIALGSYRLSLEKPGYAAQAVVVNVPTRSEQTVDLELGRAGAH